MPTEDAEAARRRAVTFFASRWIERFKHVHGLCGRDAYQELTGKGVIVNLQEFYDREHEHDAVTILCHLDEATGRPAAQADATWDDAALPR